MRSRVAVTLVALAIGLTGCTDSPDAVPEQDRGGASPEASELAPIPAELRVALPAAPTRAPNHVVIDLEAAAKAPSVDREPVRAGMMLAQLSMFSDDAYGRVPAGMPYLLTRNGEWRQFDLSRYGFGDRVYAELSTAITADGRKVAFADPSGLVTVDLRDNAFKRFDLPVREAIALEWSPDGSTLLLKDRYSRRRPCGPRGCRLDVASGRLSPQPFDMFFSTQSPTGGVYELTPSTDEDPTQVVRHRDDEQPSAVPLQYLTAPGTAGGPAAARHVAYAQCGSRRSVGRAGVVVVDPSSGDLVSMLGNDRRPGCRLGAVEWLDDQRLVVGDWRSGDLWLWDVMQNSFLQAGVGHTRGVNFEIAGEVMATRFRGSLPTTP